MASPVFRREAPKDWKCHNFLRTYVLTLLVLSIAGIGYALITGRPSASYLHFYASVKASLYSTLYFFWASRLRCAAYS